jgi:hypothetical protein
MKLFIKSYVVFVPVEDGVYFEAGQDNFLLKGRGIFPLVSRMVALLDGTRTREALEAVIPEKARPLFALLLAELERKKMLQLVPDGVEAALPETIRALYADSIGYLKDQLADWPTAFRRWRETPIIAAGAGLSHRVMVRNLLGSGVRRLFVALEESEDAAADRSAIAATVAEAVGRDREVAVRWLDSAETEAEAAAVESRSLYVGDDVPSARDSLFHRLIGLDRPGTLAGGIFRGTGIVGPELGDGVPLLGVWERISESGPNVPYPRAARAILGSVMAFEALKSLVFVESTDPAQRGWLRRHCYRVGPDTTIQVHALAPASVAATAPSLAPGADAAAADDDPLFDPLAGSLRWDEFVGQEFPLPHRAIAIRTRPGGTFDGAVEQWALTPQDLDARTTARALEALGQAGVELSPAVPGCAWSPVVAARDEPTWRAEARAQATARHECFLSRAKPARLDPESLSGDDDAAMLLRLVRLYTGSMPALWLFGGGGGWGACLACVAVDGQLSRAAASTPSKALVEALGDALSAVQTGRLPERQRQPFLGPLETVRPDPNQQPVALADAGSSEPLGLRFEESRLFPAGAASRAWVVGRVRACR